MPGFLKSLFVLLFAFSSSILILYATFKTAGYSTDMVKLEVKKSGVYDELSKQIQNNTKQFLADDNSKAKDIKIVDQLFEEFNSGYLELKTNQFIDDFTSWTSGKTNTPPEISLVDLKEKILKKNPQFINMMKEIEQAAKEAKESGQIEPLSDNTDLLTKNGNNNFSQFLEQDPVIKLEKSLAPVRSIYQAYKIGFYVTLVVLLFSLAMVILTSTTISSRLKWTAWSFGIAALGNGISFGLIWLLYKSDPLPNALSNIFGIRINQNELGIKMIDLAHNLGDPWFYSYFRMQIICLIIFLVIFILCFVLSKKFEVTTTKDHARVRH